MVLSSSALGAGSINKFDHYQGVEGRRGPLYNKPRVAARQWVPPSYSGGMVQYVFDEMAKYAIATNQPLNNPHNESLRPLKQTWVFLVRGAGGYAAGHAYRSTDRTVMGWGFGGDAMLGAWLSDTGLEKNLAHEMIFIGDKEGRDEWEEGWRKENISNTLHSRLYWGSADAQTGSFIHEIYHGAFDSIHVANVKEVSEGLNDKVRRGMVSRQRANAMLQLWIQDPMGGMLAGGHLEWPKPGSRLNPVTLAEMVDTPLWA